MAPTVDPAILEALGLDPAVTKITSHGGSGFASTFKLSSKADGEDVKYFVKTGNGADAQLMFHGEFDLDISSSSSYDIRHRSRRDNRERRLNLKQENTCL